MKTMSQKSHPRDSRIFLNLESHTYVVDGLEGYISVSAFKQAWFGRVFDAKAIADKIVKRKDNYRYIGMTSEEIQQKWQRENEEKRKNGTDLHAMIEEFYQQPQHENATNGDFLKAYISNLYEEGGDVGHFKSEDRAWYNFLKFVRSNSHWIPVRME